MNAKNRIIIEKIILRAKSYSGKVQSILDTYSAENSKILETSKRYKEEFGQSFISQHKPELVRKTRLALDQAQKTFAEDTRHDAEDLKNELQLHFMRPLKDDFHKALSVMNDFGVKPSRIMLETLLEQNNGNSLGLMALEAVLEKNGSNFRIGHNEPEQFEKDLESVEKLVKSSDHFAPHEAHSAACDVWKGEKVVYYRPDGTQYTTGTEWDSISILAQNASMNDAVRRIEEMKDRWTADISTEIMDAVSETLKENERAEAKARGETYSPTPDPESTTKVDDVTRDAINVAKELGRDSAKKNAPINQTFRNAGIMK